MSAHEDAFDALAADYDESFGASVVGRAMRAAVRRRLDARFAAGERVLELGCGTGEDAVHLGGRGVEVLAIDRSPAMVATARTKVERAGLTDRIEVRELAIEELSKAVDGSLFDGAFSNLGALNCVADLSPVARALAAALRPGAPVVLCLMGPLVPWEWLWFLLRGRPGLAFRRLRPGGVPWRGIRVRYPSIGTVRRVLDADFRCLRRAAVGAFVPPSYAESWASRHPRAVARLDRWERRFEDRFPLPWLADHYLLELARR